MIKCFATNDLHKVTEFVMKYGKPYDPQNDNYRREPFASDVRAGKSSPIYNAHSYHTKVPPQGIDPFINHYTEPGNLVLDPFCGSGMTGVAALMRGCNSVLVDLSPAATFITSNFCTPFELDDFTREAKRIMKELESLIGWLFETRCTQCGSKSIIEYIVWSDQFECPRCKEQFLLWNVAVDENRNVKRKFSCPQCGKELQKSKCIRITSKPVMKSFTCPRCKRQRSDVDEIDLHRLDEIEERWRQVYDERTFPKETPHLPVDESGKPLWYPTERMPEGDESRRNDKIGVTHVHHFYTHRNLWALAALWNEIQSVKGERVKSELQFVFTSFNPSFVSKLTRYNFGKRGNSPMSGTLYIPSFSVERNIFSIWKAKEADILRAVRSLKFVGKAVTSCQSATDLSLIPTNSIDYVFTDPPFGSNLMYSELSFIWETWLNSFTLTENEAIINKTQGKGVPQYKELMTRAFFEIYRVLKPGRWMTMVFHNSKGEVWQAIQEGLAEAGFAIGMIGTFDKKQRSFKQVTSSGAVGYDVVVNCYKPKATVKNGIQGKTTEEAIIGFIADKLRELPSTPSDERTDRMLHSKTIGFFMQHNKTLKKLSHKDFQKILKRNFREIDDCWYLPYQRPKTLGQKRLFGYIANEAEAIDWLEALLRKTRCKYGDIVPDFFKALGPNQLKKNLQQILEESFVEENGVWRTPTTAEKERLVKKVTNKTARQIDQFLKGAVEYTPTNTELCEWIEFCYNNGIYQEGAKLFLYINESAIDPELFKKTKKVAEICKIKSWG